MPTRTTARTVPTTAELRDFLAGLSPDTDAAILRAVATVDALRASYATASRRAHVRRVARELVVLAVRGESTDPLDLGAARSDADARLSSAVDTTIDCDGSTFYDEIRACIREIRATTDRFRREDRADQLRRSGDLSHLKRLTKMRDNGELGTLVCGEQTQGESTIVELKDWASRAEDKFNAELDLVLVDYADQMAPAKECKTDYIGMKYVYQALRSWAQERNRFPVWTASQAKARQKGDAGRILGLYDAADSTHKVRIADLVITINVDKEKNEVRYFIAKHRLGKSDMLIGPLPLDFSLGRMAPIPGLSEADL